MWFKLTISKEVKDLGEEMLSFYEQIEVIHRSGYSDSKTICTFRDEDIFIKYHKNNSFRWFNGLGGITGKEKRYLIDCATRANIKKISFKDTKTD